MIPQFFWIGVSFAINFVLLMFLPFYIALPLSFVVFVAIMYIMRRNYRSAIGRTGSPLGIVRNDSPKMEYSCMACGANHKARECPRCGSKIKRVEML
ncbi:MAG: hypothetical protein AUJ08_02595 [Thaumarchaeota archaeon 13_1_40CM_3_50_5]|nr:MAG: hypothetical protein AUJ08_02595 [Thaumarchaeota archaeon 13_1_40CM_3_50_5]